MSHSTAAASQAGTSRSMRSTLLSMEIDTRLLGMIGATVVIWLGFNILSGGSFLTTRNLWNLSVQSASVAVMATGMVLIIVSRNIDLSIGSMLAFTGMLMAIMQAEWLPNNLGLGLNHPLTWIIAVSAGLLVGATIGGLQGFLVAFVGIPSFIVTLGGLLVWRGFAWTLASGRTIAPLDGTYLLLGGGPKGSVGATISWIIGGLACAALVYALISSRRRRRRYGFPVRPMWAEVAIGLVGCVGALGAVWIANNYFWPEGLAREFAQARGIAWPEGGLQIPTGIANPVLIAVAVTMVMTILATRRRFGRYVYAIGGNPEAAELGGVNTRRIIMMTFILMGILAAVSGVIATARLESATVGIGVGAELAVIAAAVIGGTSFAGGIGTIPGAVFGAVLMQSLSSGMALLKIDAPIQDIIVGIVLVTAVGLDTLLRRQDVRWSRFRPVLYVVTGLVNLLGAFFVVVGAGSSQPGSVGDAAKIIILVAGAATVVISIGTVLWPFVERTRPGSGQLIGVVGAVAAIALVLIVATLGNPAANPGFNLNMFISGVVAGLYVTIALTSGSAADRVAAPNVTAAGDAR